MITLTLAKIKLEVIKLVNLIKEKEKSIITIRIRDY